MTPDSLPNRVAVTQVSLPTTAMALPLKTTNVPGLLPPYCHSTATTACHTPLFRVAVVTVTARHRTGEMKTEKNQGPRGQREPVC
jgi:hypothetical protein